MDDIAAEAGTSKTVIYRHFDDKAGLYRAVAERIDGRVVRNVGAALSRSSTPAADTRELVASTVEAYLALVESDTEVYRFVVNRPLVDRPLADDPVGGTVDQVTDQLTGLLLEALRASTTDPSRARTWAIALVGSVRAVADDWLATPEGDRAPRASVVDSLTDLAWHGLSPVLAPDHHHDLLRSRPEGTRCPRPPTPLHRPRPHRDPHRPPQRPPPRLRTQP